MCVRALCGNQTATMSHKVNYLNDTGASGLITFCNENINSRNGIISIYYANSAKLILKNLTTFVESLDYIPATKKNSNISKRKVKKKRVRFVITHTHPKKNALLHAIQLARCAKKNIGASAPKIYRTFSHGAFVRFVHFLFTGAQLSVIKRKPIRSQVNG